VKTKIVLLVMAVLACITLNSTFELLIHPTVSAQTAVGQLADSETSVILMRSYDRLANLLPIVSWAATGLFGLLLFGPVVVTAVKQALTEETL
jgi:hypothetical protein